jgi:GTPase SAR1 family protein
MTRLKYPGKATKDYTPSAGVDKSVIDFNTNQGVATLVLWDCASREQQTSGKIRDMKDSADAAIVMFDTTSPLSLERAINVYDQLSITAILCGNKIDLKEAMVKSEVPYSNYFEISAKTGKGINKMFTSLIGLLANKQSIKVWGTSREHMHPNDLQETSDADADDEIQDVFESAVNGVIEKLEDSGMFDLSGGNEDENDNLDEGHYIMTAINGQTYKLTLTMEKI